MAMIQVQAWKCEQCDHVWLVVDSAKPPTWCAKCRSRKWNAKMFEVDLSKVPITKPEDVKTGGFKVVVPNEVVADWPGEVKHEGVRLAVEYVSPDGKTKAPEKQWVNPLAKSNERKYGKGKK